MGLDGDETTTEVARAAALARQLPHDGRVWRAVAPEASNSDELVMLRRIEHNQRMWHWAHTKDAESKSNEPEPVLLRGEQEAHDRAVEQQERTSRDVASAFGIDLTGGVADG